MLKVPPLCNFQNRFFSLGKIFPTCFQIFFCPLLNAVKKSRFMFVLYVLKFFYVIQMDEASTQEIRKTIFSNCGKFFFFLFFWENENLRWNDWISYNAYRVRILMKKKIPKKSFTQTPNRVDKLSPVRCRLGAKGELAKAFSHSASSPYGLIANV